MFIYLYFVNQLEQLFSVDAVECFLDVYKAYVRALSSGCLYLWDKLECEDLLCAISSFTEACLFVREDLILFHVSRDVLVNDFV